MSASEPSPAIHQSPGYWVCRVASSMRACFEQRLEEEAEQWYRYARRSAAVQCTFGTPE